MNGIFLEVDINPTDKANNLKNLNSLDSKEDKDTTNNDNDNNKDTTNDDNNINKNTTDNNNDNDTIKDTETTKDTTDNNDDINKDTTNTDNISSNDLEEKNKKISLYKSFKELYSIINIFSNKLVDFNKQLDNNNQLQNLKIINFINDTIEKIKTNCEVILLEKYKIISNENLKLIFVNIKSELDLLIKLFNEIKVN